MKSLDFYYSLKPLIPRAVQISTRRAVAKHKRKHSKTVWPIDPNAAMKPDNWTEWPDNKRFALVLHHDVDSAKGVDNCTRLIAIEKQLGFRSAFFFVPEDYLTPKDLRVSLANSGFETGVHGLKHDGKLFKNPLAFSRNALKIDYYLKEWRAVGFTSPSMLRNFALMGELEIQYGCSSFDTDPFEPHSVGLRTIFPFFASNASGSKSYVELPYTLPQDHGLFVILGEKDNRIWKEKLDWIAAQGGMALLNTHPDYMNFDGTDCSLEEYPASYYTDFLDYIRTRYSGQFWHVLPREMARLWKTTRPNLGNYEKPQGTYAKPSRPHSRGAKIWIDLDNTPHVPFFIPIIRELERRGHQVFLTARDAFQVYELAAKKGLPIVRIGHHYGKNPVMKVTGLIRRSTQMISFWRRYRPHIALSHGARSQILLCNLLRTPTIEITDYEHARTLPIARPKWLIVPEAIPVGELPLRFAQVLQYPGIKEDVYVPDLDPDPLILDELGLHGNDIVITVRPPADEAHYYNPESSILMFELMSRLGQTPGVRVVMLPRNHHQEEHLRSSHPDWFRDSKAVIPSRAIDGLNLLWYSDLVVSGGGTMNREAAALGIPVYSIFRGKTGAVDSMLERDGRLTMIHTPDEVWTKIRIEKRATNLLPGKETRPALTKILFNIEKIIEIECAKKGCWR